MRVSIVVKARSKTRGLVLAGGVAAILALAAGPAAAQQFHHNGRQRCDHRIGHKVSR
jgi:hypothetical protein